MVFCVSFGLDQSNHLSYGVFLKQSQIDTLISGPRSEFSAEALIPKYGLQEVLESPPIESLQLIRMLRKMRNQFMTYLSKVRDYQ
jgi:hypothetical protein